MIKRIIFISVFTRTAWTPSHPLDVKLETWRTSTPTWQLLAAGSTWPPPEDFSRTLTCRWWAVPGLLVGQWFCMMIMRRSTEEIEWHARAFLDYTDIRKLILIMLILKKNILENIKFLFSLIIHLNLIPIIFNIFNG